MLFLGETLVDYVFSRQNLTENFSFGQKSIRITQKDCPEVVAVKYASGSVQSDADGFFEEFSSC